MSDKQVFLFDLGAEVDRFFDDSSFVKDSKPSFVLIAGGVCSGKTTLRRHRYTMGYVVLDAAEIFLSLSRGGYYDFPNAFLQPMNVIGPMVAARAIRERRNMVMEIIGNRRGDLDAIAGAVSAAGYKLNAIYVNCDPHEGWVRNQNRGNDNISAIYTQEFHCRWLIDAVKVSIGFQN